MVKSDHAVVIMGMEIKVKQRNRNEHVKLDNNIVMNAQTLLELREYPGNTKGGSITVPLTSCLTGLIESVLQIKTKIISSQKADSKPVKQEVNGTVILPTLVFLWNA
jgi:hypothetical protein